MNSDNRDFPVIGLCGYARAGKDTAARALIREGYTRAAFADALKSDVIGALRQSLLSADTGSFVPGNNLFDDPVVKEKLRPLLVEYGRALRNVFCGDHWIHRMARKVEHGVMDGHKFVVTDVRYENEAEWVRRAGGIVIRVVRTGYGPANPEEEASMTKDFEDYVVTNNGSVDELHKAVLDCAESARAIRRACG